MITESAVEEAALNWLAALGYTIAHGPDIARLATLRDTQLPKLMRVEVWMKDAEHEGRWNAKDAK